MKRSIKISNEEKAILICCSVNVNDFMKEFKELTNDTFNWDKFIDLAVKNGIPALVYSKIKNYDFIPSDFLTRFKEYYYYNLSKNMNLLIKSGKLLKELEEKNIKAIVLKGLSLVNKGYKDIALRQMGDLDLYIRKSDVEQALQIAYKHGFIHEMPTASKLNPKLDFIHAKHLPALHNGEFYLEIHTELFPNMGKLEEKAWETVIKNKLKEVDYYELIPEIYIVYLLYHLNSHIRGNDFHIKLLYDVAILIQSSIDTLNWEQLINSLQKTEDYDRNISHLKFIQAFMSVDIPENIFVLDDNAIFFDWKQYIMYLNAGKKNDDILKSKWNTFKQVKGLRNNLIFIGSFLFPSIKFMKLRYQVKNNGWLLFYYVYRPINFVFKMVLLPFRKILKMFKKWYNNI